MATLVEVERLRLSVGDTAKMLYPGLEFDTALPQDWVNELLAKGYDIRAQAVWAYPAGCAFGEPFPLTEEGAAILKHYGFSGWPVSVERMP